MAKGDQKVEQTVQAQAEARERAMQQGLPQLKTGHVKAARGGSPVTVRFLEQGEDKNSYDIHEFQVPDGKGGFYRRQYTCLREAPWRNSECPMCAAGVKTKLRGVYNVIQRQRPVFRKDKDGRAMKDPQGNYITDGYEDAVVILNVPSTTAAEIVNKDGAYKGLMSRDITLSDSGNTFQPWAIEPADVGSPGTPLSENDMALAAKKHNLDEFMKPPTPQEAAQVVFAYGGNSGASPNAQVPMASPQGTANQAGQASGFLAGAQVPAGAPAGSAFGAAQQPAPPAASPVPAQQ